tara:strand:- start:178 stop:357 length:180 start_codon:yes stop_codon:yes gene_type:complete
MKKIKDWNKLLAFMSALLLVFGTACSSGVEEDPEAQTKESAQPVEEDPEAETDVSGEGQ